MSQNRKAAGTSQWTSTLKCGEDLHVRNDRVTRPSCIAILTVCFTFARSLKKDYHTQEGSGWRSRGSSEHLDRWGGDSISCGRTRG
ncbi:hypothetical protein NDU88_006670 [Pleurodeles waltl]|uniref:Uncharacterized protein n=1 Tax=Pleurodeles waltl TaxID=8319 RepID=A0AAV7WBC0_PLEWA|nr:hypothetical protein NDU88_006670 [Pleurodeles waltl]